MRGLNKKRINVVNIVFGLYLLFCIISILSMSEFRGKLFLGSLLSVPIILVLALKKRKLKILKALYVSATVFIFSIVAFHGSNENITNENVSNQISNDGNNSSILSIAKVKSESKSPLVKETKNLVTEETNKEIINETVKETVKEITRETVKETLKESPIQEKQNTKIVKNNDSKSKSVNSVLNTTSLKENNKKYYEIEKVVDGDTIRIYKDGRVEKIRLLLVDTPESVHSQQYKNVKLGTTASNFTKDFLRGHKVRLEYDIEKKDRYGRTLAYVYRDDGKSLNKALLYASLAKVVVYKPNDKYYDEYKAIERQVRPNGNGIWANIEAAFPGKPKEVKVADQKKKAVKKQKFLNSESKPKKVDTSSQKALIKGNINSKGEKIYHVPGMRDYNKTKINTSKGERWFRTEQEAKNAGWRRAKR